MKIECEIKLKASTIGMIIGIISACISIPLVVYYIILRGQKAEKIEISPGKELIEEIRLIKQRIESLKSLGYEVGECENELILAENAFKMNLKDLTKTHLENAKEILDKISRL